MPISGKAKLTIQPTEVEKAKNILAEFDEHWKYTSVILNVPLSRGAKYHYMQHVVDWMEVWSVPIGYVSEQSIEGFHKTCSMVYHR